MSPRPTNRRKQHVLALHAAVMALAKAEGIDPIDLARMGIRVFEAPMPDIAESLGEAGFALDVYRDSLGIADEAYEQSVDRAGRTSIREAVACPA